MNERAQRLFEAISDISEEKIEDAAPQEAEPTRRKGRAALSFQGDRLHGPREARSTRRKRWTALAAAAVLAVGLGGWWTLSHWRLGANSTGISGHENGSTVFMSYAGPVLPLTALEGGESLTARRELTYDFSPWTPVWWSNEDEANSRDHLTEQERQEVLDRYNKWYPEGGQWQSSTDLLVTDAYTLTNPTEEDRTVTLLYPFASSLRDLNERAPTLSVDGTGLETTLHAGDYSGAFQAVEGSDDQEHLLNLDQLNSWEEYKALLSDGRYQAAALGDYPDLSGVPVTVYKFTGAYGPQPDSKADIPNPTIQARFKLDFDGTTVLSYGFSGGSWNRTNGTMAKSFSIRRPGWGDYGVPSYLFVMGEDIRDLTTGGYVTGGADQDTEKLEDGTWGVEVERYETDLESALGEAAKLMYDTPFLESMFGTIDPAARPDFEMYFGLMKEFLLTYGVLSPDGPERYDTGMLEDLDVVNVDRVFYLEAEVAVPAGGQVTVAADMVKPASFDHYCAHTENQDISGYDMVTKLGSNLDFTSQTAKAVNTAAVEIVRQNYGFDWENGVDEVELDPDVEHYYLEVRQKTE